MRATLTLVLIASAFAVQAVAQPALPSRKPGLWQQTMSSGKPGQKPTPMVTTLCLDASVDKAVSIMGQGFGEKSCSSNSVTRAGAGYKFNSNCAFGGGGKIVTEGTVSGDFSSSYQVQMNSVVSGAPMAAMNGAAATTIAAKWMGACPAGTKPGDMTMPGGIKVNMLDAMKRMPR